MSIEVPYWIAVTVTIVSVLLILLSLVLAGHMAWRWIEAHKDNIRAHWTQHRRQYSHGFGLLLIGVCVGWLTGGHIPGFWRYSQSTGPIVWNFEETAAGKGYFLAMQKTEGKEITAVGFAAIGKNISPDPINDFQGYIRSDMTNETVPIYILAANTVATRACTLAVPTLPEDTKGIPGFSLVQIVGYKKPLFVNVPYSDAVPFSKFAGEFAPFTVVLKYNGKSYKRQFSREEIERQKVVFEKASGPPTEPYVVRKESAPPSTILPPLTPLIKLDSWHPPANPDLTGTILDRK
ncbi:MAG TPA: hypothetical protein VIJ04_19850 [Xanthobacteraceae bacterium]